MTELPTRTFEVFGATNDRAQHWKVYHGPCATEPSDRQIQWRFSDGTGGLGRTIHIACLSCGTYLDVSDYDSW